MRIVSKQEFYKLPAGTLYSNYIPCIFEGLKIKGDTICHDGEPSDFFYEDLIGNVDVESSEEFCNILEKAVKDKTEFALDFDCGERDGLYDDEDMYAVYNPEEILELSNKIAKCLDLLKTTEVKL